MDNLKDKPWHPKGEVDLLSQLDNAEGPRLSRRKLAAVDIAGTGYPELAYTGLEPIRRVENIEEYEDEPEEFVHQVRPKPSTFMQCVTASVIGVVFFAAATVSFNLVQDAREAKVDKILETLPHFFVERKEHSTAINRIMEETRARTEVLTQGDEASHNEIFGVIFKIKVSESEEIPDYTKQNLLKLFEDASAKAKIEEAALKEWRGRGK